MIVMPHLIKSLNAWTTPEFSSVLKQELEQLEITQLPLQQGLTSSSYVLDRPIKVMALNYEDQPTHINAKIGIFYRGMISGCNCADDPTPEDEIAEYCEVLVLIHKQTGVADFQLVTDANERI